MIHCTVSVYMTALMPPCGVHHGNGPHDDYGLGYVHAHKGGRGEFGSGQDLTGGEAHVTDGRNKCRGQGNGFSVTVLENFGEGLHFVGDAPTSVATTERPRCHLVIFLLPTK